MQQSSPYYSGYKNNHVLICNRISFDLVVGDIAASTEDTVINSTDDDVNLGVSVAKALADKAGPAYRQACKDLVPLAEGMVKETGAYDMPCKQILHCNCPYWRTISQSSEGVKEVFIKCLERSAQKGYKSLATPAIGMGAKSHPKDVVALALLEAVAEYAGKNPESSIKQVKLYLYQEEEVFRSTMLLLGGKRTANGHDLTFGAILEVFTGDLVTTEADVIVNSTGSSMSLSGGHVASALLEGAGKSLQDECDTLSPIEDGDVAVTKGYGLSCTHVAHACTPSWEGEETEKELRALIMKCLEAADYKRATSVAFPALGAGLLEYPPAAVARAFFQASAEFAICDSRRCLNIIKVVILTDDDLVKDGFEKELGRKLKPYVQPPAVVSKPLRTDKLIEDLPTTWLQPLQEYRDFVVTDKKELADCISCFKSTLDNAKNWEVLQVTRVQNPDSYQLYNNWRLSVARKLRKQEREVEKILWHGTKEESVAKITRSRFDRGFAGDEVGTLYGFGSYFATTSEYSVGFCDANDNGECFIIMARVITGDYKQGSSDMKSSPYKNNSKLEQYDSVVDDESDPKMFVVFHDAAAYPEYVIKFKRAPVNSSDISYNLSTSRPSSAHTAQPRSSVTSKRASPIMSATRCGYSRLSGTPPTARRISLQRRNVAPDNNSNDTCTIL